MMPAVPADGYPLYKKAWNLIMPVPPIEAFALPDSSKRATKTHAYVNTDGHTYGICRNIHNTMGIYRCNVFDESLKFAKFQWIKNKA